MDSTIDQLLDCLEQEHRALLAEDLIALESIVARKERLLSSLSTLQPAVDPRSATIRNERLAQAQRLNQRNAATLSPRLAVNRVRLNALHGARNGDATVYNASGAVSLR